MLVIIYVKIAQARVKSWEWSHPYSCNDLTTICFKLIGELKVSTIKKPIKSDSLVSIMQMVRASEYQSSIRVTQYK